MSRLASFRGPSTPSSSPVQPKQNLSASLSRNIESTYHRKVRALLKELRGISETWQDLVLIDGLGSARSLVDTRTELEYVSIGKLSMLIYFRLFPVMLWHSSQTNFRVLRSSAQNWRSWRNGLQSWIQSFRN